MLTEQQNMQVGTSTTSQPTMMTHHFGHAPEMLRPVKHCLTIVDRSGREIHMNMSAVDMQSACKLSILLRMSALLEQDAAKQILSAPQNSCQMTQKIPNAAAVVVDGYVPKKRKIRCPSQDEFEAEFSDGPVLPQVRRKRKLKHSCTWTACSARFTRKDVLERHYRIHTGDKPYKCGTCERRFARRDHLNKHIRGLCHFSDDSDFGAGVE